MPTSGVRGLGVGCETINQTNEVSECRSIYHIAYQNLDRNEWICDHDEDKLTKVDEDVCRR